MCESDRLYAIDGITHAPPEETADEAGVLLDNGRGRLIVG